MSDTSNQFISARTLFSVCPTGPPSSPPPTSPLPPLPATAPYELPRRSSTTSRVPRGQRPQRPPRPRTSLTDLQPRTIKSPENTPGKRCSKFVASRKVLPGPGNTVKKVKASVNYTGVRKPRSSIRFLTPAASPSSSFSDDVLSSLPKLFQQCSPRVSPTPVSSRTQSPNDLSTKPRAWQVYNQSSIHDCSRRGGSRTDSHRSVARTALFIPRSPPAVSDHNSNNPRRGMPRHSDGSRELTHPGFQSPSARAEQRSQHLPATPKMAPSTSPVHDLRLPTNAISVCDFGDPFVDVHQTITDESQEDITSLPELSTSTTATTTTTHKSSKPVSPTSWCGIPVNKSLHRQKGILEEPAFSSVLYAHTLANAGPPPIRRQESRLVPELGGRAIERKLHKNSTSQSTSSSYDAEAAQDEERILTPEEQRQRRRIRIVWAIATIALVFIATGGILGGIISKLDTLS